MLSVAQILLGQMVRWTEKYVEGSGSGLLEYIILAIT
jgi:hypothetical protein